MANQPDQDQAGKLLWRRVNPAHWTLEWLLLFTAALGLYGLSSGQIPAPPANPNQLLKSLGTAVDANITEISSATLVRRQLRRNRRAGWLQYRLDLNWLEADGTKRRVVGYAISEQTAQKIGIFRDSSAVPTTIRIRHVPGPASQPQPTRQRPMLTAVKKFQTCIPARLCQELHVEATLNEFDFYRELFAAVVWVTNRLFVLSISAFFLLLTARLAGVRKPWNRDTH
jgi:hypothetical protein